MTKVPKWVWIALVGASLALPMLGSYGLWDPAEIKEADIARAVAEAGSYGDVTVGGKHAARPVLQTWLVALGFKFFGINELAGRLPLALCLLGALLLAYRFVRRLFDEQTALVAAFFLATTPVFIFQGRQLTSDIVFYLTQIAALGGLLAYLAPADGRRLRVDLAIGAVGLVGGFLARGLMIGTLLPLIALGLALAILWSLRPEPAPDDAAALEAQQSLVALGQNLALERLPY